MDEELSKLTDFQLRLTVGIRAMQILRDMGGGGNTFPSI